jgi:hypothetical protein
MSLAATVKYETLVRAYEQALVDVLRHHSAGEAYLELWVPDEDPVKSILNMIEAAQAAGRDGLAVEVSSRTLSSEQTARLELLAARYGAVTVVPAGTSYMISVADLRSGPAEPAEHATNVPARSPAAKVAVAGGTHNSEDAPLAEIIPALAPSLVPDQAGLTHEGQLAETENLVLVRVESGQGALAVLADPHTHLIVAARHDSFSSEQRRLVAEMTCRTIEARTVQDAGEHGALLALHRMHGLAGRQPLRGILLPRNGGTAFVVITKMLRELRRRYADAAGIPAAVNVFEPAPSARWQSLPAAEKMRDVQVEIDKFAQARRLSIGVVRAERIEKDLTGHDLRVVISIDTEHSVADKPAMMRALERQLKAAVEDRLQLYLDPLKDRNKIRRL